MATARDPDTVSLSRPWRSESVFALGLAALLALAVAALYQQVRAHEFVSFDDPIYVTANAAVTGGLGREGLRYAFEGGHGGNWHPLTTLSHQLDVELFGVGSGAAGAHLLVNAALHAAAAALLLLALHALTGSLWASALAAALFALHPLRAESVAWVSSRKDVLSGLFFALTLLAWAGYARRPSLPRYAAVAAALALGLMAKPMLVTVPALLLLLDYWPLRRWPGGRDAAPRLLLEKLPLLALALASSAATVIAQAGAGTINSWERLPLAWRLANAPVAVLGYLGRWLRPTELGSFYPHPALLPSADLQVHALRGLGALALLVALSLAALAVARRRPYAIVGWLWFLGMLVPVIGLVQVGSQALADRYTYLPQIGLGLVLAFALRDLAGRWPRAAGPLAALALGACAALSLLSWRQIGTWRSSETVYLRSLEVTRENYLAHRGLGGVYLREQRYAEALEAYQRALATGPEDAGLHSNLGAAYLGLGRELRASQHYRYALRLDPESPEARANLAQLRLSQGAPGAAEAELRRALRARPDDVGIRRALARVRFRAGDTREAARELERAAELAPDRGDILTDLGAVRLAAGDASGAVEAYRRAIDAEPARPEPYNGLAWILATSPDASLRDGAEAVRVARRGLALAGGETPDALDTLAAAHAESGDFTAAARWQERAVREAPAERRPAFEARLALYRSGRAYRDAPPAPPAAGDGPPARPAAGNEPAAGDAPPGTGGR